MMGGLGIFALIMFLTLIATILGAVAWLAILPGKVARRRGHPLCVVMSSVSIPFTHDIIVRHCS